MRSINPDKQGWLAWMGEANKCGFVCSRLGNNKVTKLAGISDLFFFFLWF